MARPLRITYPGAYYHITSRGNEKKPIFKNRSDRERFLEYLKSATERYDAVIHVYCLMGNHYHLLLETPSGNLSQIMRHINGAYTTYFNVKRKRSGHLFQGRYKSILVDKDEYAKELSRYIHLNPVRAEMLKNAEEYQWSSYQFYIGKKKSPDWLHMNFILGYFGKTVSKAQKQYHQFVTMLIDRKYEDPLNDTVASTILGTPDFVDYIKDRYLSGKTTDKDLPALKELSKKVTIPDITNVVDDLFGEDQLLARNLNIYFSQRYTGEKLMDIGNRYGISESAVSHVCRRMANRIKSDTRLRRKVLKIDKTINLSRFNGLFPKPLFREIIFR